MLSRTFRMYKLRLAQAMFVRRRWGMPHFTFVIWSMRDTDVPPAQSQSRFQDFRLGSMARVFRGSRLRSYIFVVCLETLRNLLSQPTKLEGGENAGISYWDHTIISKGFLLFAAIHCGDIFGARNNSRLSYPVLFWLASRITWPNVYRIHNTALRKSIIYSYDVISVQSSLF